MLWIFATNMCNKLTIKFKLLRVLTVMQVWHPQNLVKVAKTIESYGSNEIKKTNYQVKLSFVYLMHLWKMNQSLNENISSYEFKLW